MAEFDAILRCTLGGSTFQLVDYAYRQGPIVEEGRGEIGADVEVAGEGYVAGDDAADFVAKIGQVTASMQTPGQNFTIYGLGGEPEVAVYAARCLDGGPHVAFEITPQGAGAPLVKQIRFTLKARVQSPPFPAGSVPGYTMTTRTRPDGLREVSVKGELRTAGAAAYFRDTVQPYFDGKFPAGAWVSGYSYEAGVGDDQATYTIDYAELAEPLPGDAQAGGIDGEVVTGDERDEQMRLVRTIRFDLLVRGDPMAVRTLVRRNAATDAPLRERFEVTRHREVRVRGEFVYLSGGNGNDLLNWERTLDAREPDAGTVDVHTIPGSAPLFVRRPSAGYVYVDSGRAIGYGRYPKPPAYLSGPLFAADPEVNYVALSAAERQTTWKYTYRLPQRLTLDAALLKRLDRPAAPGFFGEGGTPA